jgi:hypothetical protein
MATLRLGDIAPDFTQDSSDGPVRTTVTCPASTGRDSARLTPQSNR